RVARLPVAVAPAVPIRRVTARLVPAPTPRAPPTHGASRRLRPAACRASRSRLRPGLLARAVRRARHPTVRVGRGAVEGSRGLAAPAGAGVPAPAAAPPVQAVASRRGAARPVPAVGPAGVGASTPAEAAPAAVVG